MKQGIKKTWAIFVMVMVLMMAALPVMAEEKPLVEIDIYSVNDFHGALRAEGTKPGIAVLAGAIQQLGAENPAGSIILGGGDMLSGTLDADEYEGMPVIYAMNQIGFSADVVGNHIFDYDQKTIAKQAAAVTFSLLAANLEYTGGNFVKPYVFLNRNGLKIGVIGVTTGEMLLKSSPQNNQGVTMLPTAETVQKYINEVRSKGAQIVILLTHCASFQNNKGQISGEITGLLERINGVDAVVTGHSHQRVFGTYKNIPVVQAGSNGEMIGKIHLLYSRIDKKIIGSNASLIAVNKDKWKESSTIAKMVNPILSDVDKKYSGVVAQNLYPLTNDRYGESTLGEHFTDLLLKGFNADVAILNGGAFRSDIPAGPITLRLMQQAYPYKDQIVVMQLKGSDLLAALEYGIGNEKVGEVRFAGVKLGVDLDLPQGSRIIENRLADNNAIDLNKQYKVVTNEFLAKGGDGYLALTKGENIRYAGDIKEFFNFALRNEKNVNHHADGRLSVGYLRLAS
ncbi:MAG: bifunctional UDP-sugar hydrolase/5'-nucleotidase [Acidaminococcaceae bacterium]